jgi:hypothetical protein
MAFAELHERFVESACRWALVGGRPAGLLLEDADGALAGARFAEDFLHTPVNTIYGGSAEIPRSLVAEVELGLPRSR